MRRKHDISKYRAGHPRGRKSGRRARWLMLGGAFAYWFWRRRGREDPGRTQAVSRQSLKRGYEWDVGLNVRRILYWGGALLVLAAVIHVVIAWMLAAMSERKVFFTAHPLPYIEEIEGPRQPALQLSPPLDLMEMHRYENERLHTYGWVNPEQGLVHIPIERAMQLVAQDSGPADTTGRAARSVLVPTESGYVLQQRGPLPPGPLPALGGSPERYHPSPRVRYRFLQHDSLARGASNGRGLSVDGGSAPAAGGHEERR